MTRPFSHQTREAEGQGHLLPRFLTAPSFFARDRRWGRHVGPFSVFADGRPASRSRPVVRSSGRPPGLAEQHFLGPSGLAAAAAASALFGVCSMAVLRRRCGAPGEREG